MNALKSIVLVSILVFLISFGSFANLSCYADYKNDTNLYSHGFPITNISDENEMLVSKHICRIPELETLNSYVFRNNDGTNSVYIFPENIKYLDHNGLVVEKCLDLVKHNDLCYTTKMNDVGVSFPCNIYDGISITYNESYLNMRPEMDFDFKIKEDKRFIEYCNDDFSIRYTPTLSGVKEEIILNSSVCKNTYSFVVCTNAVYDSISNSPQYSFVANQSNSRFCFSGIIVYDNSGKMIEGNLKIDAISNNEYLLTVEIDRSFLDDPSVLFPVIIDPSITVSSTVNPKTIEDAPVFEGLPNINFGNYIYNTVGNAGGNYGVGMTVFRLPGLYNNSVFDSIDASQITSVYFCTKEATGLPSQFVNLYRLLDASWTESGVKWNDISNSYSSFNDWGNYISNGSMTSFDITSLAQHWKTNTFDPECGFVLVNNNGTNDGSLFSTESSEKPYIVFSYDSTFDDTSVVLNRFESDFYDYDNIFNDTEELQYRANCYSYSLQMYYNGDLYGGQSIDSNNILTAYKLQPGELVVDSSSFTSEVNNYLSAMNSSAFLSFVKSKVLYDFNYLNSVYGTDWEIQGPFSVIPSTEKDSRVIALTVGIGFDYHFYMRHDDGTWSHKPGSYGASNESLSSHVVITDSNIYTAISEGGYDDGYSFFLISKPAVTDYSYGYGHGNQLYTPAYFSDRNGDVISKSRVIEMYSGNTYSWQIDYTDDKDYFCFVAPETRTYALYVNNVVPFRNNIASTDVQIVVLDSNGDIISSSSIWSQPMIPVSMSKNERYFIRIISWVSKPLTYQFHIYYM